MTELKPMRSSAIMSAYNRAAITSNALDSIAGKKRILDDVVFVEDRSTNDTLKVMKESVESQDKHNDNLSQKLHIARHIMRAISQLGPVRHEQEELVLNDYEQQALRSGLDRRAAAAVGQGIQRRDCPRLQVCRELLRRKCAAAVLHPKPMVRAMLRSPGRLRQTAAKSGDQATMNDPQRDRWRLLARAANPHDGGPNMEWIGTAPQTWMNWTRIGARRLRRSGLRGFKGDQV